MNRIAGIAAALIISIVSCGGRDIRREDIPETLYRGFVIQYGRDRPDIRKPLDFIRRNELLLFRLLKKHVRRIEYSIYYKNRNYPYYDTISMSEFSLERGEPHSASVILHELFHIVLNNLRKSSRLPDGDERVFLLKAGVTYDEIKGMGRRDEEKAAYLFQFRFIKKYGTNRDIEYLSLKLKKLRIPFH